MGTETLDTVRQAMQPSRNAMAATPNLILVGYGVADSLQLTVASQRVLGRFGAAYSLGLPSNLAAFLKSQRVKVVDLSARIAPGRPYAEAYLEVAHFLLERTAEERPVVLLAPGHPLIFNSLGRYLAMEGRRLGLVVQVLPALSPVDAIIGGIGLDVSTFGVQVFDATRLVRRRLPINPQVPAIIMHLGGFDAATVPQPGQGGVGLTPLVDFLANCYPAEHPATIVAFDGTGIAMTAATLSSLPSMPAALQSGAHLFLDLVRPASLSESTAPQTDSIPPRG